MMRPLSLHSTLSATPLQTKDHQLRAQLRDRSQSHECRLNEFERAVAMEIERMNGQSDMFLRTNSHLLAIVKDLAFHQGRAYFRYVFRELFGVHSKIYTQVTSTTQILEYAEDILKRLVKGLHAAPYILRVCTNSALQQYQKAFPQLSFEKATTTVLGNILILRIIGPALVKPEVLNFPTHTRQSLSVCGELAKLFQHTLSGRLLMDRSPLFVDGNVFINTYNSYLHDYLCEFPKQSLKTTGLPVTNNEDDSDGQLLSAISKSKQTNTALRSKVSIASDNTDIIDDSNNNVEEDITSRLFRASEKQTLASMKTKRKRSFRFWQRFSCSSVG